MTRILFATAVAGVLLAAAPGTSQATPIAPLPAGVTSQQAQATPVYWRYRHWHRWHRRCWRGRYGRLHCW